MEEKIQGPINHILRVFGTFLVFHVLPQTSPLAAPPPGDAERHVPSPTLLY